MPFSFASQALREDRANTPVYAGHLLPSLQSALATLADLDTRFEMERDHLEEWIGPDEVKVRLIAALEARWQRDREPIVWRLTRLQNAVLDKPHPRQAATPNQPASFQRLNSAAVARSPL